MLTRVADSLTFAKAGFATLFEIEYLASINKVEQIKFEAEKIKSKLEELNKQLVKFEFCLKENKSLGD